MALVFFLNFNTTKAKFDYKKKHWSLEPALISSFVVLRKRELLKFSQSKVIFHL